MFDLEREGVERESEGGFEIDGVMNKKKMKVKKDERGVGGFIVCGILALG
ncbi:hypothetical protein Hanom_Chr16g01517601 [Helianthus anomalus]